MTETKLRAPKVSRKTHLDGAKSIYTTSDVGRILGVSSRTAAEKMDKHPDLCYRINNDRRIAHANLLKMAERLGLTPLHLPGLPAALTAWVGRPSETYLEVDDVVGLTPVSAGDALRRGRVTGVLCLSHNMTIEEVADFAEAAFVPGCRTAISLHDDQLALKSKSSLVWMFDRNETRNADAARWVRRMESK